MQNKTHETVLALFNQTSTKLASSLLVAEAIDVWFDSKLTAIGVV
jgi:hypothetical protein